MKEEQPFYQQRIVTDPRILAGKPVIKGTHIGVDLVLEERAHNPDITELLAAHPDLTCDDVQACLAYAQAIVTGEDFSQSRRRELALMRSFGSLAFVTATQTGRALRRTRSFVTAVRQREGVTQ